MQSSILRPKYLPQHPIVKHTQPSSYLSVTTYDSIKSHTMSIVVLLSCLVTTQHIYHQDNIIRGIVNNSRATYRVCPGNVYSISSARDQLPLLKIPGPSITRCSFFIEQILGMPSIVQAGNQQKVVY